MNTNPISSLAIAGAWGYIGRKFLDAARQLELATFVYDTGPIPQDIDLHGITCFDKEADFFRQPADLFHLALHPEHRLSGLDILLERSRSEQLFLLCEKPMAAPESPEECQRQVTNFGRSSLVALYDFPELYDPITHRVLAFLQGFKQVSIESIVMQRSKDREDPSIARNAKRMVHIQYQESVHCLAFALNLLSHLAGELPAVFRNGVTARAESQSYSPPNPSFYPYVVDGRCEYQLKIGDVHVTGTTDFTRGAPWAKRRTIAGHADGRSFEIAIDFLEGQKKLTINGVSQNDVVATDSYVEVIRTISRWRRSANSVELMTGIYPNPEFARVAYQLSSLLWKCSWSQEETTLKTFDELLAFDAGFALALPTFARY